ncbi:Peptide-methionine sulfoxide reductase MsrA/MsrB [[Mycoplasma] cavipharyngis]
MKKFVDYRFSEKNLSSKSKEVLYQNGTESPFNNEYWNHWEQGIYVDPSNGDALFSSYDKFSSSCGWPAFYRPIESHLVKTKEDYSHNMYRTEVRTANTDLHLGHVFDDLDPNVLAKGAQRYCINSAALKFISEKEIIASGHQPWIDFWSHSKAKNQKDVAMITIAGGCFWGVQHLIRDISGVYFTTVGYANANSDKPVTYSQVCSGDTGATEAVQVFYNKKYLDLDHLLTIVFSHVDPTTLNQQGNDRGSQYRSGVYYSELDDATKIKHFFAKLQKYWTKPIVSEILPLKNYYLAEEYHQDYLIKNPHGYCHIKKR